MIVAPSDREIGALTARMAAMERTIEAMSEKVDRVHDAMLKAEGGWKTMLVLGSIAAALGAAAAKVIDWIGVFTAARP